MYPDKIPGWVQTFFPSVVWRIPKNPLGLYLTFDDGPDPEVTPEVLKLLQVSKAQATFFVLGRQLKQYPGLVKEMSAEGHSIGLHSYSHLNGWRTPLGQYLEDHRRAADLLENCLGRKTRLFRPPFGKISPAQARKISLSHRIIMWEVNSGDFDKKRNGQQCFEKVSKYAGAGSVILFHDSVLALERLSYALPETLRYFSDKGFSFSAISEDI